MFVQFSKRFFTTFSHSVFVFLILLTSNCYSHNDNPNDDSNSTPSVPSNAGHAKSHMDLELSMPNVRPSKNDDYICTYKNIEDLGTRYIHKFEPNSHADLAHHMLLYTCDDIDPSLVHLDHWDCNHHASACRQMRIIYAWAKNAPPTSLAKDVAFRIGSSAGIKNLVLQVHYVHSLPDGVTDASGFKLHTSTEEPTFLAGIMILLRGSLSIPPHQEKIHGDMNCVHNSPAPIHPFAFRVHTHKLGSVVSGYILKNQGQEFLPLAKGNPQWPQAFYPIKENYTINPRDIVVAQCNFNTTNFDKSTEIGMTAGDEMCNLYIMFYTQSRDPEDHFIQCMDEQFPQITQYMPRDSDMPLPRNKSLEEHAMGSGHEHEGSEDIQSASTQSSSDKKKNHAKKRPGVDRVNEGGAMEFGAQEHTEEQGIDDANRISRKLKSSYHVLSNWPDSSVQLGQASGVDLDLSGNVVVFHRGDRIWGQGTFDLKNNFLQKSLGPIKQNTVYVLDTTSGKILHEWGSNRFYMPHDITVAPNGDTFLTDVALHQVFRFEPGHSEPSLVKGEAFVPGKDDNHFCKPAAVAVMKDGTFFVADGYCNSRIIKFDKDGTKLLQWGRAFEPSFMERLTLKGPPDYALTIPHALALAEEEKMIYVADRENGRIQCFSTDDGSFHSSIKSSLFGRTVYSVAYSPIEGGTLYAVNGPESNAKCQGFVIPISSEKVTSVFSPNGNAFGRPHDVVVNKNGTSVYVVEISQPYHVWKFDRNSDDPISMSNVRTGKGHQMDESISPAHSMAVAEGHQSNEEDSMHMNMLPTPPNESPHKIMQVNDDAFSNSVIIMAFLTIPLLLLIAIGALLRLRSSTGCCKRSKESKSFSEFFPPSAGFEKLRMDESDSENSDTEVEEYAVPSYRKTLSA